MSRVSDIGPESLPDDLRTLYQRYATDHGRFGNQVAILAHVRPALRHLTAMLMELRGDGTVSRRHIELAVVAVSKLNACDYCVAHHAPALVVEGLSPAAVEHVLDYRDHPDLDAIDGWSSSTPSRSPRALGASATGCSSGCAGISTRRRLSR